MVPRRAVVPGSVVSGAPLTSKVVTDPIYKGEQITLRQFAPAEQGGIFAKFSGKERAVAVLGEPQQLLAGTLSDGDYVDVVATAQYTASAPSPRDDQGRPAEPARARGARREATGAVANNEKMTAMLVMSDSQAQTMGWAMKMSTWFLALRPTDNRATARRASRRCIRSSPVVSRRARPPSRSSALPGERR